MCQAFWCTKLATPNTDSLAKQTSIRKAYFISFMPYTIAVELSSEVLIMRMFTIFFIIIVFNLSFVLASHTQIVPISPLCPVNTNFLFPDKYVQLIYWDGSTPLPFSKWRNSFWSILFYSEATNMLFLFSTYFMLFLK